MLAGEYNTLPLDINASMTQRIRPTLFALGTASTLFSLLMIGLFLVVYFSAFLHTLRWNCVTATDPNLFQSPFRAGIRIDTCQMEPLRKALRLPEISTSFT